MSHKSKVYWDIGMLAGWRGVDGGDVGKGDPNPDQLDRYIENQCFWRGELPVAQRYFRNVNRDYLSFAKEMGFVIDESPIICQLYSEEIQRFRLSARGHGEVRPPARESERIETYFDPLPIWYPPFENQDAENYPLHAITQRPMAMYHSWGAQNAWLRQIHGSNRLYVPSSQARAIDVADDDWVWLISRNGRIKVQVRLMDGVNPNTVWTWNAIGKRAGSWNLAPDAPEARNGFLMNHLIDELLPPRDDGYRYSNSDPVTGQAAWFDLRVRMEKAAPDEVAEVVPQFEPLGAPPNSDTRPAVLRYGAKFRDDGDG